MRALVLLAALGALTAVQGGHAQPPPHPGASWQQGSFQHALSVSAELQATVERLKAERNKWKRSAHANAALARRLQGSLRHTYKPVWYALALGSAAYGVPLSKMRAVAWCESRLWEFARNGQYRGLFQEGPMFESGPFGRAGFSVWDPVANALTAAYTVVHDGSWRQWECG